MAAPEERLARVERRLEQLEETIEVLSNTKLARSIDRALRDLRAGRYRKYADVDELFRDIERAR